jgi:hypothetical protein
VALATAINLGQKSSPNNNYLPTYNPAVINNPSADNNVATEITPSPQISPSFSTLPYTADWTQGLGGWTTWYADQNNFSVLNGNLVSNGRTFGGINAPLLAPINLGTPDYTVEARIKIDSLADLGNGGSAFGFILRGTDLWNCYTLSIGGYDGVKTGKVGHSVYDLSAIATSISWQADNGGDYIPDMNWHTYQASAIGNQITLSVDGQVLAQITDNKFLNPGQVGLWSNNYQLEVSSFIVR